jgi:glycosyltransferase involved in cell wall biosynthesis
VGALKIALVTTPPSVRSGIGDYTRHLLPYLRELLDVQIFVEDQLAGEELLGEVTQPASDLRARSFDRVLYQLGNERGHAFMIPMIESIGGTVMQHDWVLFDLATAAFPALATGGVRGHWLALREGGAREARTYYRNRRQRRQSQIDARAAGIELQPGGALQHGFWAPESGGRWTAPRAGIWIPSETCKRVRVEFDSADRRTVRLMTATGEAARGTETLEFELQPEEPYFEILTTRVRRTAAQKSNQDTRDLGVFLTRVLYEDESGEHELDLSAPAVRPPLTVELSRDRFQLALNHAVVRKGDSFLVHNLWMRRAILDERNGPTPAAVVTHGAERRWSDEPRNAARERLGLPAEWNDGLLLVSFGAIQEHKRIGPLLAALAEARRTHADIHLVLAGEVRTESLDLSSELAELGLEDAVRITGWLEEAQGFDALHAANVCVNLRGPSTMGVSGGVFQAFSMGRGAVVSDIPETAELPDDCVCKVAPGDAEVAELARVFVRLREHAEERSALEAGARRFVDEVCHWSHVAQRYAQCLEGFPAHRANQKSLIQGAIEAADKAREERARETSS